MFIFILTLFTAITISIAAMYYSITGMATIFAGAALSTMIMMSILEVSKLVTVVWLHRFWKQSVWWLKTYLTIAVVILMLITSMGIFGGLSKAHIEQTASATAAEQRIDQIEAELSELNATIERAEQEIEDAETRSFEVSADIQSQIDREQERIDNALARVQPEIDRQVAIIEREQGSDLLQEQLDAIDENLSQLESADVRTIQGIVGVNQDGVLGPDTRNAIAAYRAAQENRRLELIEQIQEARSAPNPAIERAEAEISRLRALAEQEIAESNRLINRLREQLGQDNSEEVAAIISAQEQIISDARDEIETLRDEKFQLETDLRLLEVEVGPVRYIAELVYGETNQELLEQSVRWVILILIFVFDPLAVLLLIASQYAYDIHRKKLEVKKSADESINTWDILDLTEKEVFEDETHEEENATERKPDDEHYVIRLNKKAKNK